jgi:LemA protein
MLATARARSLWLEISLVRNVFSPPVMTTWRTQGGKSAAREAKAVRGAALLALLFALIGCGYNEIIERDEEVKGAWAEVQNQYKRRADLIPSLVKVVQGAANFEQETLKQVVEARASVAGVKVDASTIEDPAKLAQFEAAQAKLSGALSRLLVVAENYPDLKASAAFRDLQAQLEGTENRIAVARGRYIEQVAEYNKVVLRFPTSIGAGMRGK